MTADRDRWVREEVLAAGAFDLLWKPLRLEEVTGALERALRGDAGAVADGPPAP
jgi:hypothetical protein